MSSTGPLGTTVRHRYWRRFLLSVAVSRTADLVYTVALVVYLIEETRSAAWVAASVSVRIAAFLVFSPFGGVVADRFDRRRLLVAVDALRAAVMTAAAIIVVLHGSPAALLVLIAANAAIGTAYRPAVIAATTTMVPEDQLASANAAHATVGQVGWFAGPALGTAIVTAGGAAAGFAATAAAFALSALAVRGIGDITAGAAAPATGVAPERVLRQLVEGARAIRRLPGLLALLMLFGAVYFSFGIEQVVQVLVVRDRLGMDAGGVGLLTASMGAGGLVAVPLARRAGAAANGGGLLALSGVLLGAPLALLTITTRPDVAVGLMLVEGVGNVLLDVVFITMLQRVCPEALIGRIFALQITGGCLAQLAGTIAAPAVVGSATLEAAMLVGGGSLVASSLALFPSLQAISRRTESERVRLAPITAMLGELGILGTATLAARERIARSASSLGVPAGHVVFSEGDAASDLFIITSGSVSVSTTEHGHVRTLSTGDWFGEIGLLRGIPRTATVTTTEATEMLAVPGGVFVAAVTAGTALPDLLAATLHERLLRTHPQLVAEHGASAESRSAS